MGALGMAVAEVHMQKASAVGAAVGADLSAAQMLAVQRLEQGNLPEALRLYQKVLKETKALVGPEHFETAIAHNNVGEVYRELSNNQ